MPCQPVNVSQYAEVRPPLVRCNRAIETSIKGGCAGTLAAGARAARAEARRGEYFPSAPRSGDLSPEDVEDLEALR